MAEQGAELLRTAPPHPVHPEMLSFYAWIAVALYFIACGVIIALIDRRDRVPRDQGD